MRQGHSAARLAPPGYRRGDTPWPRSEQHYIRLSQRFGRSAPLAGYSWLANPCASWPQQHPKSPVIDGKGLPTVLMINSMYDPATPIEGARRAHRAFAGSRLVTVRNDGDHGLFGSGNTCIDAIGTRFLVTGVAPATDTTCEGTPLPEPDTRKVPAAEPAADKNILEPNEELTRRHVG